MSRFSAITQGTRATKPVEFPLDGKVVKCAVRPLLAREYSGVLEDARAYAVKRGVAEPTDTNPIYQLGVWLYTLATGCVDADAPDQAFFDEGVEQILGGLDVDRIALLYEAQQRWQDYCSPNPKTLGGEDYIAKVLEIAAAEEGDDAPFVRLPRVLLESLALTMAKQLVLSLQPKLPSGSDLETSSKSN